MPRANVNKATGHTQSKNYQKWLQTHYQRVEAQRPAALLLTKDQETIRAMLRFYRAHGCELHISNTSANAIETLNRSLLEGNAFRHIFIDPMVGEVAGVTGCLQALRQIGEKHGTTARIIRLCANDEDSGAGMSTEEQQYDEVFFTPFDGDELLLLISDQLKPAGQHRLSIASTVAPPFVQGGTHGGWQTLPTSPDSDPPAAVAGTIPAYSRPTADDAWQVKPTSPGGDLPPSTPASLLKLVQAQEAENKARMQHLINTLSHEQHNGLYGIILLCRQLLTAGDMPAVIVPQLKQILQLAREQNNVLNTVLQIGEFTPDSISCKNIDFNALEMLDQALELVSLDNAHDFPALKITVASQDIATSRLHGDGEKLKDIIVNISKLVMPFLSASLPLQLQQTTQASAEQITLTWHLPKACLTSIQAHIDILQTANGADLTRLSQAHNMPVITARRFIEVLHGQIKFEHNAEGGVLHISIPFKEAVPKAAVDFDPKNFNILVVDDVKLNRDLLSRMLTKKGYQVDIATDGKDAVAKASTTTFDLILMDLLMPIMDGFTASRIIKGFIGKATPCTVPIFALTGNNEESSQKDAFCAGMSTFFTKPVAPGVLLPALKQALLQKGPSSLLFRYPKEQDSQPVAEQPAVIP